MQQPLSIQWNLKIDEIDAQFEELNELAQAEMETNPDLEETLRRAAVLIEELREFNLTN
jgi:hypothetical protein